MNTSKVDGFFEPDQNRIHIIGAGSVGSSVAIALARCGVTKMTLWDFDTVSPHNIANQEYRQQDIGKLKTDALKNLLVEINPDIETDIKLKSDGWDGQILSGYVFMCCDGIELRRRICETLKQAIDVKVVFDFRTGLTTAQHYAADWNNNKQVENLINSMSFTHEEAAETTPVSACGVTLGVVTTVRLIAAYGVNNYINYIKGNGLKTLVLVDGNNFIVDAF